MPDFEELPFDIRPDLSPYLIHLTKNTIKEDEFSAFDNLVSILKTGLIWGSDKKKGFIKGPNKATCFMDIPLISLKYVLNEYDSNPENPRYEPFGVIIQKGLAYKSGCRPVIYLSNYELEKINIPEDELWRVVRFEVNEEGWISWLHEREWRCKNDFAMVLRPLAVLVKDTKSAYRLNKMITNKPGEFKAKPQSIIPLNVVCQGLPYL